MNKKHILTAWVIAATAFAGCTSTPKEESLCHIHGIANERFEGKKIFLVPVNGPATTETVDSVVITDGRFEFVSEPGEMKVIRIDYRYRTGVEDLLVVMEPGEVEVTIDTISSGKGTPQNNTLQQWKEQTLQHHRRLAPIRKKIREATKAGHSTTAEALQQQVDSLEKAYKRYSRHLTDQLGEGTLYDFMNTRFPLSYPKKQPDGTITTVEVVY